MGIESILVLLIVGAVAGWLAGLIVSGFGFGLIGNIVVGIIGALIAGYLFPAIGINPRHRYHGGDHSRDDRRRDPSGAHPHRQTGLKWRYPSEDSPTMGTGLRTRSFSDNNRYGDLRPTNQARTRERHAPVVVAAQ